MKGKWTCSIDGKVVAVGETEIVQCDRTELVHLSYTKTTGLLIIPWPMGIDGLPEPVCMSLTNLKEPEDICGLCGQPGADKIPHPIRWPGERKPDTDLVHSECEQEECGRAHGLLTQQQREEFIRNSY